LILATALAAAQTPPAASPSTAKPQLKFDHQLHLKLGDIGAVLKGARKSGGHLLPDATTPGPGCEACHSGMRDNVKRAGLSKMADCLTCHPKIDPPFSCEFCHPNSEAALKPATHFKGFLDKHSAGLAKLNMTKTECAVCHGRKFTCLGCH